MARALGLHPRGQGFDSLILHQKKVPKVQENKHIKKAHNKEFLKYWNTVRICGGACK